MEPTLAAAIERHAKALEDLAAAIRSMYAAGEKAQPRRGAKAKASSAPEPAAATPASEPDANADNSAAVGDAADAPKPPGQTPQPDQPAQTIVPTAAGVITGRKPLRKEWTHCAPVEMRSRCEGAIRTLFGAGRQSDIVRCLDSVDASRLSDVQDFLLSHLYAALEVALEENGLE